MVDREDNEDDEDEKDLPEADLLDDVGKSNEKGTVTRISDPKSGMGRVRSKEVLIPGNK